MMITELNKSLEKGLASIRNKEHLEGRALIGEVLKEHPDGLSASVETTQERKKCVETVLEPDPENKKAKIILSKLGEIPVAPKSKVPELHRPSHEKASFQLEDKFDGLLRQGIAFIRNKEPFKGKPLITEVVKERPDDVWAWLWLAASVETNHERRQCVETVLALDPNNRQAKKIMRNLDEISKLEELSMVRHIKHIKPFKTLPAFQKIDVERLKSSCPKKKLHLKSKLRRKLMSLKRMAYTGMIVLPLVICILLLSKALFDILSMYLMAVSFFSP